MERSRPRWSEPSPTPNRDEQHDDGTQPEVGQDVLECLRTTRWDLFSAVVTICKTSGGRRRRSSSRMSCGWLKTDEHALAGGLAAKLSEAEGRAIKLLTPPKPPSHRPTHRLPGANGSRSAQGKKDRLSSKEWSTTAEELHAETGRESALSAHGPVDVGGGAAMSVGTLSPQQLRSLVEDKWQRDEEALAVGLHVTTAWVGPSEVEFDFGKAQVVRADTVFQVVRRCWTPNETRAGSSC